MLQTILLLWGFVFTFFLPGACLTELFANRLPAGIKLLLYSVISVIVSTFLVYSVSLVLGFSRYSILLSSVVFLPLLWEARRNIFRTFMKVWSDHRWAIFLSVVVYFLYGIALYPAIFALHNGYLVMSSVNWQDTAMHISIIETIAQGNFPPQAPYYAGVPLDYYYFVDFHSAIIVKLYGNFFPRILIYENPVFSGIFFYSAYLLAYTVLKKKGLALASAFSTTFFGSFLFVKFLSAIWTGSGWKVLLTTNDYSLEYGKLFQMVNMATYFLQNRPMMFGLPVFLTVCLLLFYGFKKNDLKILVLSGFIVGTLIKFQFFALIVSLVAFGMVWLFYLPKKGMKNFTAILAFVLPLLVFLIFFTPQSISGRSALQVIKESFFFGPWEKGKDFYWYLKFFLLNMGQIVVFGLISLLISWRKNKNWFLLSALFALFVIFPCVIRFTIYNYDMFKFFYFAVPLGVISTIYFLNLCKLKTVKTVLIATFVLICSFSSLLTLANSFLNKNMGYSLTDLEVGLWVRKNTPQKSVFVTYPSVHAAVSEIGGRLRFLSYINWPHSHGYNTGENNVFTRLGKLGVIYSSLDDKAVRLLLYEDKIDYLYLSIEERREWGDNTLFFDSRSYLRKVYDKDNVAIYEVL